jgi:glucose dehydrogenase
MGYDVPHEKVAATTYDVVIVGSGFTGANLAYLLASQYDKTVLIIEAGPGLERSREDYMENFFLNTFKSPSAPYPPNPNNAVLGVPAQNINVPRATIQDLVLAWGNNSLSYLTYPKLDPPVTTAFASTYERVAGGTGNHWLGTCLRMSPYDLATRTHFGVGLDWPIDYRQLSDCYDRAEALIGVSASVDEQEETVGQDWRAAGEHQFSGGYRYPMNPLPVSYLDQIFADTVAGNPLTADNPAAAVVSQTPAGRNSQPYMNRRVCHGNTNCTPICPIQAKYDPQFTLALAMDTGKVDMIAKSVVDYVTTDETSGQVTGVHYIRYDDTSVPAKTGATGAGTATGRVYVIAAHAIENAKILLNTKRITGNNVANRSGMVGKNLMDHPTYLAWGLMPEGRPCYSFRGPLSTAGIENLRNSEPGGWRNQRAPWRIQISNDGWSWPANDPYTTGLDYIYGTNNGGTNGPRVVYGNADYHKALNSILTRQFSLAFLVEQPASESNLIELSSTYTDNLGIPRPEIRYNLDDYTKAGIANARSAARTIIALLGATEYTKTSESSPTFFTYDGQGYEYAGPGHVCGTHIMGTNPSLSVVDGNQKSHDHLNLYIAGCGSMPSIGTQNPSLTMLALACRTAEQISRDLA